MDESEIYLRYVEVLKSVISFQGRIIRTHGATGLVIPFPRLSFCSMNAQKDINKFVLWEAVSEVRVNGQLPYRESVVKYVNFYIGSLQLAHISLAKGDYPILPHLEAYIDRYTHMDKIFYEINMAILRKHST